MEENKPSLIRIVAAYDRIADAGHKKIYQDLADE